MSVALTLRGDSLSRVHTRPGRRGRGGTVAAVSDVSLSLEPGQRMAIVGRSGSGKSTLLRMLLALDLPDSGGVSYGGRKVEPGSLRSLRWYRRSVQYIPQDPALSLSPRMSVGALVSDPLRRLGIEGDHRGMTRRALAQVDLGPRFESRRRNELSGGQAQRVAIARALAIGAGTLLADEPVSGLDLPLRDETLELLHRLSVEGGMSILMVTHDLEAAARLCTDAMVMSAGEVVERAPISQLLSSPAHPETRLLLRSVPRLPTPLSP
ncbi:ATP-binding cassette domain-containing protein [Corynebacterium pacaense]|uniref:ATP-binding cassette domain-containing protein n=1 Tax=Corynebacterium pacaense TaxID=1816684 RepID=UPI001FED0628|nr:ABC transporter ATP-binding protein [Corynebacterium pacaense]